MDVAILVPLEEEFSELFRDISGACTPEKDPRTNRSFYAFRRPGTGGRDYTCVTTFIGDMGEQGAGSLTRTLIERYQPNTIVLLGIAGSLSKEVRVCDVVVADQIDDYLARSKVVPGADKSWDIRLSGRSYKPDVRIVNSIKFLEFDNREICRRLRTAGQADLKELCPGYGDLLDAGIVSSEFKMHSGPVASGEIVSASAEFSRWLLDRDRKYKAIEMEAAGVMREIYESAGNQKVTVLRGVSDCSDERKTKLDGIADGSLRIVGVRNAVRVLWALFEVGAFERQTELAQSASSSEALPTSLAQARKILERLDPAEIQELTELIVILELLCAKVSHFEKRDFQIRAAKTAENPVVMPKELAEAAKELKSMFGEDGLSWKERVYLKALAPFFRKKLNDALASETGLTENAVWQRLLSRKDTTTVAFLIYTLYEIKTGSVSVQLEPRIKQEFALRQWPLPVL